MLASTLDSTAKIFYDDNGYFLARGLFGPDEISFYCQHFMEMRERGSYPYPKRGDRLCTRITII